MNQNLDTILAWILVLLVGIGYVTLVKPKPHEPKSRALPDGEVDLETQRNFFDCVVRGDHEAVQQYLDQGFPVNKPYPTGKKPLWLAVERGDLAMVQRLAAAGAALDDVDATGWTPLMLAVRRDHHDVAAFLIEAGVPLDRQSAEGQTALHLAAGYGKCDILHLLLEAGADAAVCDAIGHQPLRAAVEENDHEAAAALLEAGNDARLVDGDGVAPLHFAQTRPAPDEAMIALLQTKQGAKPKPPKHKPAAAPEQPKNKRSLPFGAFSLLFLAVAGVWFLLQESPFTKGDQAATQPAEVAIPTGFAHIAGGPFKMGCSPNDLLCNDDEQPLHEVQVDGFLLAQHEVTVGDYRRFLQSGHALAARRTMPAGDDETLPITKVTWYDAVAYCNWLSAENKLQPVYRFRDDWSAIPVVAAEDCADDCALKFPLQLDAQADGFRLPTEAEWEKAARGTQLANIYPWGPDPVMKDNLLRCNFDSDAVMPVGSFAFYRGFGDTYDLAGNVAEWVQDFYAADFYQRQQSANPINDAFGNERVIRGGSFLSSENGVRVSARDFAYPSAGQETIGFRTARNWGR